MSSKKSSSLTKYQTIIFVVGAFILGGVLGGYLCKGVRPNLIPKTKTVENIKVEEKEQTYTNEKYGFSFEYPEGSKIESSSTDFLVTVIPPAEYALAETELTIKAIKEPYGESIEKLLKQDVQSSSKNLFTGVLPAEIDGLPVEKFYTIVCPERGDCKKLSKYYVNSKGNTYIISTSTYTDASYKPRREYVTEDIVSSLKF